MYLKQHVFLTGCQIHLVLIIVDTDVDNVCQKLLIARNHLQLLVQALHRIREETTGHLQINSFIDRKSLHIDILYIVYDMDKDEH